MRWFGKASAEPLAGGGVKVKLQSQTGSSVDMELAPESAQEFRDKVLISTPQRGNMSQIKKVTSFLREDVPAINAKADALHERAQATKSAVAGLMDNIEADLVELEKEVAELQAAAGLSSNFPPRGDS